MDNPEKLAAYGTQDEEKQNKQAKKQKIKNTVCVGHYYAQTNTNNVNNFYSIHIHYSDQKSKMATIQTTSSYHNDHH